MIQLTEFEGFTFENSSQFTRVFPSENDRNCYISVFQTKKWYVSLGRKDLDLIFWFNILKLLLKSDAVGNVKINNKDNNDLVNI